MKTLRLACALHLATVAIAAVLADTPNLSAGDFLVTLPSRPQAALGMSPGELTAMLGAPSAKLAPDVWVYLDFTPFSAPERAKYDALVVVLANDRVSRLRLCPSAPVRAFIARQQAAAATQVIVLK